MTTEEIKSEIKKSLDKVPESVLQDILAFLKQAENQTADQLTVMKNLRDIFAPHQRHSPEDVNVLNLLRFISSTSLSGDIEGVKSR